MIGRAAEEAIVEELIGDARAGRSGALLIAGEAGIGKSALLAHARAACGGTRTLAIGGSEAESHLAFAGLAGLLDPLLGHLGELPAPQAEALRGALALGPPSPGDRFTVSAATLSLLAAGAEAEPLVCIIDDAHWLDAESLEALQFAGRRLEAEGVALLLAARDGASRTVDAWSLPRLRLGGLDGADAAALIAQHAPVAPAPGVLEALVAGAEGNPLALIELGTALAPAQLSGREPLPDPLPVGPYLRDALLRPVRTLPEPTRRALLVASADDGTAGLLGAALAAEGLATADLEPAERAGVLVIGPAGARFSHPLVRAAVYQAADRPALRAAHRAHAAAATALGESALDRQAWHLALAATGPDEEVASALEQAAGRAAARNGHAAACEALEAAARLSPDVAERGRRLAGAGQSALAGDFARAGRLFDEVIALDADPALVVHAMVGRGYVETFAGSTRRAIAMLEAAAARIEPGSPAAAAQLLARASITAVVHGDLPRAIALTERAISLSASGPAAVAAFAQAANAVISTYSGRPREPSPESRSDLAHQAASGDPASFAMLIGCFQALMFTERYAEAEAALDEMVAAARQRSAPSMLTLPLFSRAELRRRVGRLDEAVADAAESLGLAEDTGQGASAGAARWTLALIDAVRGRADDCRAQAARVVALGVEGDAQVLLIYADQVLGLLALSEGDLDGALHNLRSAERRYRDAGGSHHPLIDAHEQDLVETLIRLGRHEEAEHALATLDVRARRAGSTWAAAAVERCRGLMAGDDAFEGHFAEALALHARTPTPFERARTELCLGERRRRAKRVREARAPLTSAFETFEALGAVPWAEWARRELRATGARPRGPQPSATGELTPQELQVALTVARGATNKEAASGLLISPKTVEYHLAKVYAKLGVRTRAELAHRLSGAPAPID
jgi:ATP/maltotriose-dependent transcriptional regulator MalT